LKTFPTPLRGLSEDYFNFEEEARDRIWEIYRMRKVDRMTMDAIGQKLGVSRERIRQLVNRANAFESKRRKLIRRLVRKDVPLRMEDLPLRPWEMYAIKKLKATRMTPEEFAETITFVEFAAVKNIGIHRLQTFFAVFKEVCPDAADLWTSRNR
jgi:hypothetical protein